ncbi:hypothetical protein BABA_12291 [Neobacillus bataviensis LMG 21833]|uniref:Uncharacterized protein n=1 Tax=Neobacillus bataviensis LMG 21833 TaxID=1117379 RepID=K6E6C4_9BACI|nr:hypothetical protein BABA_12291 [Neobacillus bataviensis LMG 21833]
MEINKMGVLSNNGKIFSKASMWRKKANNIKRMIRKKGILPTVNSTFTRIFTTKSIVHLMII